jgi:hypothetical protein
MLCSGAIDAMRKYGKTTTGTQRGIVVDYAGLPGAIPRVMLPLFGVSVNTEWVDNMKINAEFYSKGAKKTSVFTGDSKEKEENANKDIMAAADGLLKPSYGVLTKLAVESVLPVLIKTGAALSPNAKVDTIDIMWAELKELPTK